LPGGTGSDYHGTSGSERLCRRGDPEENLGNSKAFIVRKEGAISPPKKLWLSWPSGSLPYKKICDVVFIYEIFKNQFGKILWWVLKVG
jgi:hypothetical protein